MKPADDPILEVIRGDGNMTPLAVSKEGWIPRVDITRKYAGVRCRALARRGLLAAVDKGLYRITDEGLQYLDEELDADTLEERESIRPDHD